MSRAESRNIPRRWALSLDINRPGGFQNFVATVRIAAPLNAGRLTKSTVQPNRPGPASVPPLKQPALRARPQRAEQIHVAIAAKIRAQGRAKQFQPGDAARPAELRDLFRGQSGWAVRRRSWLKASRKTRFRATLFARLRASLPSPVIEKPRRCKSRRGILLSINSSPRRSVAKAGQPLHHGHLSR